MLFDPANPLPHYPSWKIDIQLQTRAALPPRTFEPRYVWIVTARPDWNTLEHARAAVFGVHKLASCNWHVIVCHADIARNIVIETCESYGFGYKVTSERRAWELANKIVCFGRSDILRKAVRRRVPIWYNQRAIELPGWQMELPFRYELVRAA